MLFSLPIDLKGPNGGDLVDLTPVFMSDLPQIGQVLPGFMFSPQKSTWADGEGLSPTTSSWKSPPPMPPAARPEIDTVPD